MDKKDSKATNKSAKKLIQKIVKFFENKYKEELSLPVIVMFDNCRKVLPTLISHELEILHKTTNIIPVGTNLERK